MSSLTTVLRSFVEEEAEESATNKWEQGQPPVIYEDEGDVIYGDFTNKQGLKLQTYTWLASKAVPFKGDILTVHGLGVHTRYTFLNHVEYNKERKPSYHPPTFSGSVAEYFTSKGYNLHGYDLQSYGLSEGREGLRGFFLTYSEHVEDFVQFAEIVKEEYTPSHLVIMATSAGGCIATRAVELNPELVDALILYAPMLSIDQVLEQTSNRILLPIASCLAYAFPKARLGSFAQNPKYPEEDDYIFNDPLCDVAAIRAKSGIAALEIVPLVQSGFQLIEIPILVFHSVHDTNCDIRGSQKLIEICKSKRKSLITLETRWSYHSLLIEPDRYETMDQTLEWLSGL